ncbi:hypothetical protein BKA70DRAFT_1505314 [Coprinopsis sp. MPI-PUGE-AT-0042]|nr:hypothetical protein BKA70DRAFT_1505314 [Coprinopsis sp. MPI-PUGE-AT-0042]
MCSLARARPTNHRTTRAPAITLVPAHQVVYEFEAVGGDMNVGMGLLLLDGFPYPFFSSANRTISALLFTQATTPNTQVYASIEKCFHQLFDKLEPAPAHHFAPTKDGTYIGFNVDSVGTIKSNLAYVQGPWLPSSNSLWASEQVLGTRPPLGVTRENWEGANFFIHNYPPDGGAERNFDPNYQPKETEKLDTLAEDKSTLLLLSSSPLPVWPTNSAPGTYGADEEAGSLQQFKFYRVDATRRCQCQCLRRFRTQQRQLHGPTRGPVQSHDVYVWNTALPSRDGDPEAAIMIMSSPAVFLLVSLVDLSNSCFGMGERWGDFLATIVRANKVYSEYGMTRISVNPEGVYSTKEAGNGIQDAGELQSLVPLLPTHPLVNFHHQTSNELQSPSETELVICGRLLADNSFPHCLLLMNLRARSNYSIRQEDEKLYGKRKILATKKSGEYTAFLKNTELLLLSLLLVN